VFMGWGWLQFRIKVKGEVKVWSKITGLVSGTGKRYPRC